MNWINYTGVFIGLIVVLPSLIIGSKIVIKGLKDKEHKKWAIFSKEHPNE